MTDKVKFDLYKLASESNATTGELPPINDPIPLFKKYPELQKKISYISLCNLPTPITSCENIAKNTAIKKLFIKRDDLTFKADGSCVKFGGNKPRKLEFMLADAIANGAKSVITFGCVGSNHACATALCCKDLGLNCTLVLLPQPNSKIVLRNLLLDFYSKAELIYTPTVQLRAIATINKMVMHKLAYGEFPYFIPTGASCPLGSLGYVNAMFELKEQIDAGVMAEPEYIYITLGSAGTMAGALVGAKAAGLKGKIVGIAVEPESEPKQFVNKLAKLTKEIVELLVSADRNFPNFVIAENDYSVVYEFSGKKYALFTDEATQAIKFMKDVENIQLDGVYTGKAFAGMLSDIKKRNIENNVILFFNTFCSSDFDNITNAIDYHQLPKPLHQFFESATQD